MTRLTAQELWALYNANTNCPAWEHVLRHGESFHDDRAWTVRWGGTNQKPKFFNDLSDHPRILEPGPKGPSSAAGAFQITMTTWDSLAYLGLQDFSPTSQRIAMMALTERRGALDDVLNGRLDEAMLKCRDEWSSLPYGKDGQPTIELAEAHQVFRQYGGVIGTQPAAPIEEIDLSGVPPRVETPVEEPTSSFDWGAVAKVGGTIASFFNPIAGAAIMALSPLLQSKIETTLSKHSDPATAKVIATNLTDVIGKTVARETGITDPFQAVVKMKETPEIIAKVEQAVVSRLDQMAPFLDKLHQQSKDEWAAEEESRKLAVERVSGSALGPRIQLTVLQATLALLAVAFVYTGALIAWQMYLKEGSEPNGQLMILFVMLATMVANVYRTVADWGYGSSKNSAAKDLTISEFSKK